MFNRPTNASMTRHMWSTGISSFQGRGKHRRLLPRLTPDIRHKKMPPLPRGHLLIPYQGRLVFRNRLLKGRSSTLAPTLTPSLDDVTVEERDDVTVEERRFSAALGAPSSWALAPWGRADERN